jgi:hypothetical protein
MNIYELLDAVTTNPVIVEQVPGISDIELVDGCFCINLERSDVTTKLEFFIDDDIVVTEYMVDDSGYVLDEVTMTFDNADDCIAFVIDNYFTAK